jgi:cytochrome P450
MMFDMRQFNTLGKTWEEKFYTTRIIHTMEMQNIQHVASTAFQDYGKSLIRANERFTGKGIFSQEGIEWRHSRDIVKPTFSRAELSDVDSLEVHFERLLELIPRDGSTIDLQEPLHKFV